MITGRERCNPTEPIAPLEPTEDPAAEPATLPACEPRACATPVPSRAAPVALAPARNVRRVVLRELEGVEGWEGVEELGSCGLALRFVIAAKLSAKPVAAVASA